MHPDDRAVLANIALVDNEGLPAPREQLLNQALHARYIVRVRYGARIHLHEFFARIAHHLAKGVVDLQESLVRRPDGHADGFRAEESLQPPATFVQGRFRILRKVSDARAQVRPLLNTVSQSRGLRAANASSLDRIDGKDNGEDAGEPSSLF